MLGNYCFMKSTHNLYLILASKLTTTIRSMQLVQVLQLQLVLQIQPVLQLQLVWLRQLSQQRRQQPSQPQLWQFRPLPWQPRHRPCLSVPGREGGYSGIVKVVIVWL